MPQIIIPIPLHPRRLRQRGFNQALEIAKPIAKKFHVPLDTAHCQRVRYTEAQTQIPAEHRGSNVKNAFVVDKKFFCGENSNISHVAIMDDVVTTGHTVNELSRALRKAGVKTIDVWCCARTRKK